MKAGMCHHRKTKRLARALDVRQPEAVGLLAMLVAYAAAYAPDGDLSDLEPAEIADELGWPEDDADRLVECLSATGWLDPHPSGRGYVIHDWLDHCEQFVVKKLKTAGRLPPLWEKAHGVPNGFYGPANAVSSDCVTTGSQRLSGAYPTDSQSVSDGRPSYAFANPVALANPDAKAKANTTTNPAPDAASAGGDDAGGGGALDFFRAALEERGISEPTLGKLCREVSPVSPAAVRDLWMQTQGAKNRVGALISKLLAGEGAKAEARAAKRQAEVDAVPNIGVKSSTVDGLADGQPNGTTDQPPAPDPEPPVDPELLKARDRFAAEAFVEAMNPATAQRLLPDVLRIPGCGNVASVDPKTADDRLKLHYFRCARTRPELAEKVAAAERIGVEAAVAELQQHVEDELRPKW